MKNTCRKLSQVLQYSARLLLFVETFHTAPCDRNHGIFVFCWHWFCLGSEMLQHLCGYLNTKHPYVHVCVYHVFCCPLVHPCIAELILCFNYYCSITHYCEYPKGFHFIWVFWSSFDSSSLYILSVLLDIFAAGILKFTVYLGYQFFTR